MRKTCLTLALLALFAAGCGSGSSNTTKTAAPPASTSTQPSGNAAAIAAAEHPSAGSFPSSKGQTLTSLVQHASSQAGLGLSTGTFVPGQNRFGFAIVDPKRALVYGPTALYVARSPKSPATGPFVAPIDSMVVPPQYRSKNAAAGPGTIEAIYSAHVPLPKAGHYYALALTQVNGKMVAASTPFIVKRSSTIPAVGGTGPAIDTLVTGQAKPSQITTRIPPEQGMNTASFKDIVGKKPVVLLFSTPALCQSRVCGPVTDIGQYMQSLYGSKIAFVHQEVYVANNPSKGLRPQLLAYHLQTEPWLFTFNKQGKIAARIEGAFGINEFRQAIQAALR
jgi:hypothetical protein